MQRATSSSTEVPFQSPTMTGIRHMFQKRPRSKAIATPATE